MGSANKVDVILFQETLDNWLSESVADTSVVFTPTALTLLGICPQQIAKQTIFGNFGGASDLLKLGNGHKLGGETSVHAEDLVVNQSCDGHAVEHVLELLPDSNAVSALALVVESVNTVDLSTLVVTSQQEKVFLEFDFVGQKEDDSLEGLLATIDIVS